MKEMINGLKRVILAGIQPTLNFFNGDRHTQRAVILAAWLLIFLLVLPVNVKSAIVKGVKSQDNSIFLLLLFTILSLSLLWSVGQRIDAWTFLFINLRGKRPYWLDALMLTVTQFGNGGVALAIACFLFIFHDHRLAYTLVLGTLTLWLVVELIKAMVHRPRPFIRLETVRIVGSPAVGRSFPSGHTSQAFFMASLFSHHFQMNLGLIVLVYLTAVLVALTRMYVGAHYPRDVLAGAVLGTFWGLMGGIIDTCCGVV